MFRDGALTLSDVRAIVCELCGPARAVSRGRLMAEHRDAKLTNLQVMLADCPKAPEGLETHLCPQPNALFRADPGEVRGAFPAVFGLARSPF